MQYVLELWVLNENPCTQPTRRVDEKDSQNYSLQRCVNRRTEFRSYRGSDEADLQLQECGVSGIWESKLVRPPMASRTRVLGSHRVHVVKRDGGTRRASKFQQIREKSPLQATPPLKLRRGEFGTAPTSRTALNSSNWRSYYSRCPALRVISLVQPSEEPIWASSATRQDVAAI